MVATRGVLPALLAVNALMSPNPLAASPMAMLLFVQEYVVPASAEPLKGIALMAEPLQTTMLDG